jgi:hypothetical protein
LFHLFPRGAGGNSGAWKNLVCYKRFLPLHRQFADVDQLLMEFPGQLLLCVPAPRRDTDGLINGGRRFGVIPILRQRFRRYSEQSNLQLLPRQQTRTMRQPPMHRDRDSMDDRNSSLPPLPAHIETIVHLMARLRSEHHRAATPVQQAIERFTTGLPSCAKPM